MPRRSLCNTLAITIALCTVATGHAQKKTKDAEHSTRAVHALLINGGGTAKANYLSHLHHIQDMYEVLRQRGLAQEDISVFSSDGQSKGKDLATRAVTKDMAGRWLMTGTSAGKLLRPRKTLVNTHWPGGPTLQPATYSALRKWFKDSRGRLGKGSTLLVFVTDHGTRGEDDLDNGNISLWNESMSVLEFRALLSQLAPEVRIVLMMSQCFSGTFANSMYGLGRAVPQGNVCGFFSTTRDRYAYGCYAEGRGRDQIGHAFQLIDALRNQRSVDSAHLQILHTDDTPDVPIRSSDVYLQHLIEDAVGASDLELAPYVDELLTQAMAHPKDYEPELRAIDAIAKQFGVSNPRRLSALDQELKNIDALLTKTQSTEDLWSKARTDLKQANLDDFLASSAGRRSGKQLEPKTLKKRKDKERDRIAQAVIPALMKFTKTRPDIEGRLKDLERKSSQTSALRYRMQKREAGMLRLRTILIRVAGLEFIAELDKDNPDRVAMDQLAMCEGYVVGKPPRNSTTEKNPELPELADDVALLEDLSPSWLGIAYRHIDKDKLPKDMGAGAVEVQRVAPDSPASDAKLQSGDIVFGVSGKIFKRPFELREWVMTAPKKTPLTLSIRRGSKNISTSISLRAHPLKVSFAPKPTEKGQPAPVLELIDIDGKPIKTSGKPYLLLYWATWCKPCKKSLPEALDWARSTGTNVIMISDESPKVQKAFLKTYKLPIPRIFASDKTRDSFRKHGVRGTPTFILVDAQGVIRYRQTGYSLKKGLIIPDWTWKKKAEQ